MDFNFAYSPQIEVLVKLVAVVYSVSIVYLLFDLILYIYGEKKSVRQRLSFSIITGGIIYPVYMNMANCFLNGTVPSRICAFIVSPNPILFLSYCLLGIWILKLLPVRSIQIIGTGFHYYTFLFWFRRLFHSIFLFPKEGPVNPLQEVVTMIMNFLLLYILYRIALGVLEKNPLRHNSCQLCTCAGRNKVIAALLLKSCVVYLIVVFFNLFIEDNVMSNFLICLFLAMFLTLTLLFENYQSIKADIFYKQLHIDSLTAAADEFQALKHDFYNILQTYNGYFALEEYEACQRYHSSLVRITVHAGDSLDLNYRLPENPALVALIIEKRKKAQDLAIKIEIALKCSLLDFPLAEIDLCRIVGCLLDNAIEAAAETQKRCISYEMEQKSSDTRRIIITNSTEKPMTNAQMFAFGKTSKRGHQGIGLNTVVRTLERYENSTLQLNYFDNQMLACLEVKNHRI